MSTAIEASDLAVFSEVPGLLRKLSSENVALLAKVAEYEKRKQAEEIVSDMDNKGLSDPDATWGEKVNALLESDTDLHVVKQATELAVSNFGFSRVSTGDDTLSTSDSFETFIQTGES